jgi:hypothetical protein
LNTFNSDLIWSSSIPFCTISYILLLYPITIIWRIYSLTEFMELYLRPFAYKVSCCYNLSTLPFVDSSSNFSCWSQPSCEITVHCDAISSWFAFKAVVIIFLQPQVIFPFLPFISLIFTYLILTMTNTYWLQTSKQFPV